MASKIAAGGGIAKAKKQDPFLTAEEIRNLALIILAGLVLRFIFYFELKNTLLFDNLYSDSRIFSDQAENIVSAGNWFGSIVFYMSPGYTYFLAFLYSFFGKDPAAVRILQILINSANIYLIYLIARELFPRVSAYISAIIAAVFSLFILYSSLLLVEVLFAFAISCFLLLMIRLDKNNSYKFLILSGIILGLAALLRGSILLFYPVALWWIYTLKKEAYSKKYISQALLFTGGILLIIFPVTLNNYIAGKQFVLLSTNSGINLYIGNHKNAEGIYKIPEKIDLSLDPTGKAYAEKISRMRMTDAQVSDFWGDKALKFITSYPGNALLLNVKKILIFFDDDENPQSFTMDPKFYERNVSFLLKLPLPGFFIILLFAATGIVLFNEKTRQFKLLLLLAAAYVLSVSIFFVLGRFRIGLMPLLIILAGFGIFRIYELLRIRAYIKLIKPAAVIAVLAGLNIFVLPAYAFNDYDAYINLGNTYFEKQEYDHALDYYRKAISLKEESGTYVLIGNTFSVQQNYKEALSAYNKAVQLNPENPLAYFNLGTLYAQTADYDDAVIALNMSIMKDSTLADAYRNLAIIYYMQENYQQSLIYFEKYLYFSKDESTKETVRKDIEEIKRRLKTAG